MGGAGASPARAWLVFHAGEGATRLAATSDMRGSMGRRAYILLCTDKLALTSASVR